MKVTLEASLVSVTDEPRFPKLIWKNLAKAFAAPPPPPPQLVLNISASIYMNK